MVWRLLFCCWIVLNYMQPSSVKMQNTYLVLFGYVCRASTRFKSNFFSNSQATLDFLVVSCVFFFFLFAFPSKQHWLPIECKWYRRHFFTWNNSIAFHVFYCAILYPVNEWLHTNSKQFCVYERAELYLFHYRRLFLVCIVTEASIAGAQRRFG